MSPWHRATAVALLGLCGCLADARIARMRMELSDLVRAGRSSHAASLESSIDALAAKEYGSLAPQALQVRLGVAEDYSTWGFPERAMEIASAILADLEQAHGATDPRITPALLSLARIHRYAHRWSESERELDRATSICRAFYSQGQGHIHRDADCYLRARYDLPSLYREVGAYEKAVDAFQLSESLYAGPTDRQSGVAMLTVYGRAYIDSGAYPEANWYLQRCLDELLPRYSRPVPSREKFWSSPSGDVEVLFLDSAHSFESQSPRCLEDLIDLRRKTGEEKAADRLEALERELWSNGPDLEKALTKTMRFSNDAWGNDYLTSSEANNLAFFHAGKGNTADAIRIYEEGIRLVDRGRTRAGFPNGVYPAQLLIDELLGLGRTCERAGRLTEAEAAYGRAVDVAAQELHPRHRWRLDSLAGLARSLTAAGHASEGESVWNRYLELAAKIRGRDHADYAFGLAGLSRAMRAAGQSAQADAARARAESIWASYSGRVRSVRDLPLPAALRSPTPLAN